MGLRVQMRNGRNSSAGCRNLMSVTAASWLLFLFCPVLVQSEDSFDLTWSTIDGGGAVSTGGGFELSGTIGQTDATATAALAGGAYALTGGFWIGFSSWCTWLAASDSDMDCDVDQADYEALAACVSGPAIPYSAGCSAKDLDLDGDVDQTDFGHLQRCFSGENATANPACLN